ncbi:ParB/RepB/Spo0J family partition protein [Leptothrix discophora]|uniref:ParB/RepB/Spo0J family partition protein n=1 Tax=Leptothrix discophora TaxID=89 RepID=A0ABT9G3B4_LEPDI|nr:ParB/RepB/Spo0J family partition protein [Leptothrix discophora]MDP4300942.1 ParB/RepB/Spo0J family partition protein [Leptothrix discophora]
MRQGDAQVDAQLDLLGSELTPGTSRTSGVNARRSARRSRPNAPCLVPIELIDEDPASPRFDFVEADLDALAADIVLRGLLVPLVIHPANPQGRYLLHFGARRLRAARQAGLTEVPVVVRLDRTDRYAQVAENLKRANLTPIDLARFIRGQIDAGDTQAEVSRRLGMNLTTVAHHLTLLDLPPVLDAALKSGRCTSPRTLHELSKLHAHRPEQVQSLVDAAEPITREAVAALREAPESIRLTHRASGSRPVHQAHAACDRLERLLPRIKPSGDADEIVDLRRRLLALADLLPMGSDGQTPDTEPGRGIEP